MNKGVICILDALGTKGVWNIQEPLAYLEKIKEVHSMLEELKLYSLKLPSPYILDYITFSDTIIISIHSEIIKSDLIIPIFTRMIDGCFTRCLEQGLLMRGAISYGDFIKSNNAIIGPAIDDAATWHDKAQLIGCILTPHTSLLYDFALYYLKQYLNEDYDYSQHAIRYATPFKDRHYDLYNMNWPLSYFKAINPLGEPQPLIRLKSSLGEYPIPPDAYIKHQNTIEFFNYSINQRKD